MIHNELNKCIRFLFIIAIIVVILAVVGIYCLIGTYRAYDTKVEQGYEVYVNGISVEPDNIDKEEYSISFDNEKKKIILTTRHNIWW